MKSISDFLIPLTAYATEWKTTSVTPELQPFNPTIRIFISAI